MYNYGTRMHCLVSIMLQRVFTPSAMLSPRRQSGRAVRKHAWDEGKVAELQTQIHALAGSKLVVAVS